MFLKPASSHSLSWIIFCRTKASSLGGHALLAELHGQDHGLQRTPLSEAVAVLDEIVEEEQVLLKGGPRFAACGERPAGGPLQRHLAAAADEGSLRLRDRWVLQERGDALAVRGLQT